MDKIKYYQEVQEVVTHSQNFTIEDLLIKQDKINVFGITSSTLNHFLRGKDVASHVEVMRNIYLFQQITRLGQEYPKIVKEAIIHDDVQQKLQLMKTTPHVIGTFHMGSYRLINALLMENDIPYSLIISASTITQQSKDFLKKSEDVYNKTLTLINAESPTCVISMIREIKKGNSLLIYLDGNMGVGGYKGKENNFCSINFLDGNLHMRKGAAYLSHIAKVPIFAASCYLRNYKDIHFDFSESIVPDPNTDREIYARSTIQSIYTHFSTIIKKYPEQWEAWLYLYKNIDTSYITEKNKVKSGNLKLQEYNPNKRVKFNLEDYSLFKSNSTYYALDKHSFISYPLEQEVYTVLVDCLAKGDIMSKRSDSTLIDRLLKNNLLIQE